MSRPEEYRRVRFPFRRKRGESMSEAACVQSRGRLFTLAVCFSAGFAAVAIKLAQVSLFQGGDEPLLAHHDVERITLPRADIVDRNGVVLATSLRTASVYANPHMIPNPREVARGLARSLRGANEEELFRKLSQDKSFVWIRRNVTPREQFLVNALGVPGIAFESEEKRIYPQANLCAHALGYVGIDNHGLAGIEKYFDKTLDRTDKDRRTVRQTPLVLSLDMRLQHLLRDELVAGVRKFSALGATGVVMDVTNGEVLAMVSLPDFDPHHPGDAEAEQKFNRAALGVYEMGSTFKTFNTAMALDYGTTTLSGGYDASAPIKFSRFTIKDTHPKNRWLSVPEIFMYSSNIGSARMAVDVGSDRQREFMKRLGLLSPVEIELPERSQPLYPPLANWKELSTMTISFGHGIAVSPLHLARGVASMVNGGVLTPLTLVKDGNADGTRNVRVIKHDTSEIMREMMRLVVEHGTGSKGSVEGYLVGGKTGTAEKNIAGGGYNKHKSLSSFVGVFPIHQPKYLVLVMIDEPQGIKETFGYSTGGWTAAPVTANVIRRMASIYGLRPVDEKSDAVKRRLWVHYNPESLQLATY